MKRISKNGYQKPYKEMNEVLRRLRGICEKNIAFIAKIWYHNGTFKDIILIRNMGV
jgi:hypothetical protein